MVHETTRFVLTLLKDVVGLINPCPPTPVTEPPKDVIAGLIDQIVGLLANRSQDVGRHGSGEYHPPKDVIAGLLSIIGGLGIPVGATQSNQPTNIQLINEIIAGLTLPSGAPDKAMSTASTDVIAGLPDIISRMDKLLIVEIFKRGDLDECKIEPLKTLFTTMGDYVKSFQDKITNIEAIQTGIETKKATFSTSLNTLKTSIEAIPHNGVAISSCAEVKADLVTIIALAQNLEDNIVCLKTKIDALKVKISRIQHLRAIQPQIAAIQTQLAAIQTQLLAKKSSATELKSQMVLWSEDRNNGLATVAFFAR